MKFIISSSELLRGILSVSKAIPAKSALPILENFLFDLKANTLQITASDTELTLRTVLEVERTDEDGQIAVPASHITNLLKELPDQPLTIQTKDSVHPHFGRNTYRKMHITCSGFFGSSEYFFDCRHIFSSFLISSVYICYPLSS